MSTKTTNEPELIDKLINKGNLIINLPCVFILMGGFIAAAFYCAQPNVTNYIPAVLLGIGGFLLAWLYWAIAITKWKIWAYAQVDNVAELKRLAIQTKLIWPDNSVFSKLAIVTANDKQKIQELEESATDRLKFKTYDDASVAESLSVFYSKTEAWILTIFGAILPLASVYMFLYEPETTTKGTILKYGGIPIGLFMLYDGINKLRKIKQPLFVLNENGITITHENINDNVSWKDITEITMVVKREGNTPKQYLVIKVPDSSHEFLSEFDIPLSRIIYHAQVYQYRYQKKQQ